MSGGQGILQLASPFIAHFTRPSGFMMPRSPEMAIEWVTIRDVQIIAFSIFGPCCDDVIASALALQVGELWRQNSNLKREGTHFEGRRVDPGSEANF